MGCPSRECEHELAQRRYLRMRAQTELLELRRAAFCRGRIGSFHERFRRRLLRIQLTPLLNLPLGLLSSARLRPEVVSTDLREARVEMR